MAKFGIGQAVRRVEDQRFLQGLGRYFEDISLPGQCHGVTVLSRHAHARIKRVDVSKAKAAPGVLCVLTGADALADYATLIRPTVGPYRLSHRRAKPSKPCGRKMTMAMKMMPTGMR